MSETKPIRPAASFALIVPELTAAIRPLGYALTLHGSMDRDLDLVAIPWVKDADDPEAVVEAITESVGGWRVHRDHEPAKRPHGRLSYSIHFRDATGMTFVDGHPYIDLSIMPPSEFSKDDG